MVGIIENQFSRNQEYVVADMIMCLTCDALDSIHVHYGKNKVDENI